LNFRNNLAKNYIIKENTYMSIEITGCIFNGVAWDGESGEAIINVSRALLNMTEFFKSCNIEIDAMLKVLGGVEASPDKVSDCDGGFGCCASDDCTIPVGTERCSNCGAKNHKGETFCWNCKNNFSGDRDANVQ
jgi:hypothetical protein